MNYATTFAAAATAMRAHGLDLVENMPDGDCVVAALADHYESGLPADVLRRHLVDSMVEHFGDDVEHDRRNGDERSTAAWHRRLVEPRQYLPPELAVRVLGDLDAPTNSVRLWAVPIGDDAPFVLYANAASDGCTRTDVELVFIRAIRHVVDTRRCAPTLTLNRRPLFAQRRSAMSLTALLRLTPVPSAAPSNETDAEKRAFGAAIERFYATNVVPPPRRATNELVARRSKRARQ